MVLAEQETQIARQRTHRRSEGRPEQKSLSWAIGNHNEARHLAMWLNGARKVSNLAMALRVRVQNTMYTMKEAYLGRNMLQGRHSLLDLRALLLSR